MIYLHFIIAGLFMVIGFCMRFGLWKSLVADAYRHIPRFKNQEFDEFEVRRFVGETSVKLGFIILAIAVVGVFDKKDFDLAVIFGWICFIIYAVASVTFIDKVDIFDKRRKAKQKAKMEQAKALYESSHGFNHGADHNTNHEANRKDDPAAPGDDEMKR